MAFHWVVMPTKRKAKTKAAPKRKAVKKKAAKKKAAPKDPPSILFIIWMSILPCFLGIFIPAMNYTGMITPGDPDEDFIAIVIWAVMTAISVLVFGFIIINDPSGKSYGASGGRGGRLGGCGGCGGGD